MSRRLAVILCVSTCPSAVLNATSYNCATYTAPGNEGVFISGINNAETLTGQYTAADGTHGFIANPSSSSFQTIDYPGSGVTQLFTINNHGAVVGRAYGGVQAWFTRDAAGNFSSITVPSGYTLQSAYGINDNGAISVQVTTPGGALADDILNPDGTLTPLPTPPGLSSPLAPGSINIAGQMVDGYLVDTSGNVTKIAYGGGPSVAYGLNNSGLVVGYTPSDSVQGPFMGFSRDSSGVYAGVICPGLSSVRFSGPRWQAVNDNGVVAGDATIATPIPGAPQVTLSATSLTFPSTPVGQTTAPQSVTITNTGNARLDIAGTSTTLSDFQLSGCGATAAVSVDPGASCTVTVTAEPMAQGLRPATLYIVDSAGGSPHTVALSVNGTVSPPSCVISGGSPGPPAQVTFTMQDTSAYGLRSIVVLGATNANATIPPFGQGSKSPVTVTASQADASQPSRIDFQVTNLAFAATTCGATFGGPSQWASLGGSVNSKIPVARNTSGLLQAFARGSDNGLWTVAQATPDNGWGNWTSLGGLLAGNPVAVVNPDGRVQVFVLGTDNAIYTIAQTASGGSWSGWQSLGGILISDPAVAADGNGNLEVVARGSDQALWVNVQTSPGNFSGWNSLGGSLANNPALIANQDGRLQAFAVGSFDGAIWTTAQTSPGGPWSGWTNLGRIFGADPVVTMNQDGRLHVFVRGTDNALWAAAQITAGGGFWGFSSLGGIIASDPAVVMNSDGRLEAFARGKDNNDLWHIAQSTPGGTWSAWATLNGILEAPVGAATNQDGRVAAFVAGTNSVLWTIEQSVPGFWN